MGYLRIAWRKVQAVSGSNEARKHPRHTHNAHKECIHQLWGPCSGLGLRFGILIREPPLIANMERALMLQVTCVMCRE